ncbi:CD109 antigen-like [Rana temporaria]|uniref:CD109 antigen-like n=1 Tax=Rana temporaria TaxID=8407 RepID=UPI001AADA3E7|nr:CD109 antigen-like [Rana temporaria]
MYTLWPQSMRHAVLLSLYLLVCSARPSYYITAPADIIKGVDISFTVHWFGDSDLTVTVGIGDSFKLLSNVTKVIKKDSIEIITLPGITKNTSFDMFDLAVNGSTQNASVFSETMMIQMQMKNPATFIQTDKTLYRPGETVQIRIISINDDMKPNTGNVELVIRDPRSNIVQKHPNMMSDLGVISTQFQLSDSPMLGYWGISATLNGTTQNFVSFIVAENVFQKFDVKLDAPSFFIASDMKNFTGKVTANYRYGKPVKGNVTITITTQAEVKAQISKEYQISGSVNFSFTYKEMYNTIYWGGINLTATVYEELTGIPVETFIYIIKEDSRYRLNIISQKPMFEQSLKYTVQIQVQRGDNKPLTKEEREKKVAVKITQSRGDFAVRNIMSVSTATFNVSWQNYTLSESGIVSLEFPIPQSFPMTQLEIEYQNATRSLYFQIPDGVTPFIQINISETSLKVGTPFHLKANTYPKAEDVYYVVSANGKVLAAGKNKTSFSLTPEQSWTPNAQILVYFLNQNNSFDGIIQTTQILPITGALKNQVTLSWSKNSAKPLENVTLTVNVKESRSLVGLRIVEKSSTLFGEANDLTSGRINDSFLRYFQRRLISLTDGVIYETYGGMGDMSREIPRLSMNEEIGIPQFLPSMPEFKETWIWLETNISSSLSRNLQVTVPDKNTTWVATAFVMSEGLGLGITGVPIELSVTKPLTMTFNMPNMLTRGEEFILEVMLSNSLTEDMQVSIALASSNSFDIIEANNNTGFVAGQRNVNILKANGTIVFFPIKPKVLGNITITVTATSNATTVSLTRYFVVRAEGVKNYYSEATLFDVRGSANAPSTVSKNFSFAFPSDLVQGSEEAFITVVGDLLGPSINGLDKLITMPYGCGEQNMIVFAPNIYILLYLIATNQIDANIREKSIKFMEQGYQRELLYLHYDGSFSAFGNYDTFGSTWLTSFVFRCFLQARPFIYIDSNVLENAVNFLIQNQDTNSGMFSEPGHVIHRELQGGLNGPITLTAYILTSILTDAYYRNIYEVNVQKAVKYLEGKYDKVIDSNYTLSIVTYALSLANSTKAQAALTLLNSRATNQVNGGTKYWSAPSESANNYWQPRSTDIETAAYALLSFQQQNRIADGIPVMKWLSQQRNQLGGYVSTQDTVIALQALSQFALPPGETSLAVTVTGPGSFVTKTFQVNSNLLALQSKQIDVLHPLSVTATAVGYGLALVQLNVVYNREASSRQRRATVSEAFKLDLNVKENVNDIYKLTVDISMSYQGEGNETGMVILEVELLNGFQLSDQGIPTTETIKLVEPKDNKVNLYLYSLTRDTVTVSVPMVRSASVAGSQDAAVKITEYYNPRNTVTRTYNSATMKKISVCDYCAPNCTQCRSDVVVKTVKPTNPPANSAYKPTFFLLCISMVFLPYLF